MTRRRITCSIVLGLLGSLALSACSGTSTKPYPEGGWPPRRLALPQWLQHPTVVVDVLWVRAAAPAPLVVDGACVLHLADDVERSLDPAEEQLAACIASGRLQLRAQPPAGGVRLHWHQVPSVAAVMAKWRQLFLEASFPLSGFYFHPDAAGPCHVVTSVAHEALGHEIKHCFDGLFHGKGNRWLAKPAAEQGGPHGR